MSDLTGVNDTLPVRIGGVSTSSGLPDYYADVLSTGQLKVAISDASGNALNSTSNALNVYIENSTIAVTQSTSPWITKDQSDGPVAPGTAASFSQLTGGQYNSTPPTLTNTQQSALQLDSAGRLLVDAAVTFPYDTNYGTVGATTLRTASEIGNATGAASFGAGTTGAQTLRVAANTYDGSGNAINSQTLSANQWLDVVIPSIGPVAPGTAAGYSDLVGGQYNQPLPVLTTGQQSAIQLDSLGRIINGGLIQTITGTINAGGGSVTANSGGSVLIEVTGTFVGTLEITGGIGPNAFGVFVGNTNGASPLAYVYATITTTGLYKVFLPAAFVTIIVTALSWTSGTATITINSGAATDVNEVVSLNQANLLATVYQGGAWSVNATNASVTNTGNPPPSEATYIGGSVTTNPPTYPSGDFEGLSLTTSGGLRVTDSSDGPVSPGTVAVSSMLSGGQYNSTLPTLTTGQQSAIQLDSSGRQIISPLTSASIVTVDQGTSPWVVQDTADGSVTGGTAGTTSLLAGGIYNSTPLTLTNGQQSSLQLNSLGYLLVAPPLLISPATQSITVEDTASTTTIGANGQNFITGTPTAGSAASFALTNEYSVIVQVTGTWTGTLQLEISMDGGTTWSPNPVNQDGTNYVLNAFSGNFTGRANVVGYTNFRVRAITVITGTAVVKITEAVGVNTVYINNPVKLTDNAGDIATIKPASTSPTATDSALVVTLSPNSSSVGVTQSTSPWIIEGDSASGAAKAGNPVQIGGVFNTTQPTVTTGQTVEAQSTARGAQIVATGVDPFNIDNITGTVSLPTGASTSANQATEITALQLIDNMIGSGPGAGAAGTGSALIGGVYNSTIPNATNGQQIALQVAQNGALIVTQDDGYKATYSANSAIAFASATLATDIFTITGSASKTIRVLRIGFSAQETTAGVANILLVKRSAANAGGTSAAATAVSHDSTNAAATATVLNYTANPTTLGAAVGTMRSARIFIPTSGTDVADSVNEWDFGMGPEQGIVLRGTTQVLALNLNGTTVTGGTWNCYVEWTEE